MKLINQSVRTFRHQGGKGWGSIGRVLLLLFPLLMPAVALGQDVTGENTQQKLRIFLDNEYRSMSSDYVQTEIDFVDWVRDRVDANVHIIVTSQSAGGGGNAYTIDFIGQNGFQDRKDSLVHTSSQTDTGDEIREAIVRLMKIGLAPYIMRTSGGQNLNLMYRESAARERSVIPENDPWNFWIFRSSLGGNIQGEKSNRTQSLNGSFSARRVTSDWKIELESRGDYSERIYELTSGNSKYFTSSVNVSGEIVKSVGDHWAAGARTTLTSSTRLNQEQVISAGPALEYSIFPYSDFTRRQLTLQYRLNVSAFDYIEETLFGNLSETLVNQSLRISLQVTQPWGSARGSIEAAHYFHDSGKYHFNASAFCDFRLFRGFSFNINGRYARVYDQLYLKAGDASDEDILLRLTKLASSYEYEIRIGFSYTFGSIFNGAVNPRLESRGMGGGGGGGNMGRGGL
ncbi:hypothetical protein ACFL3H_07800 [Gemmatimonadota bacterium]